MLKGKAIIELKNAVTGEVEKYEDENMVTKAIPDFFSHNIEGLLFNMNGSPNDLNGNMIPLCKNGIGGILLFADPLVEDENVYYAPSANPCTGYASNDVDSTANVMRGSLNLTESIKLDKGYKFVWDFATSQANGTISAVALTHKWGGIGYMGDTYDNTNKRWHMKSMGVDANATIRTAYINAVEVNFTGNYMITIGLNTSNEIVIQKIRKAYRTVGLNDTMIDNQIIIMEENKITPTIFIMSNPSNNSGNYDFFDGKDGYWYGFWHDANSSGNAVVKWIKIKKGYTESTLKGQVIGIFATALWLMEYLPGQEKRNGFQAPFIRFYQMRSTSVMPFFRRPLPRTYLKRKGKSIMDLHHSIMWKTATKPLFQEIFL